MNQAKLLIAAGVDVILGYHPGIGQPVKWITVNNGGETHKTLCMYAPGSLLTDETSDGLNCGYIFQFTLNRENGGVTVYGSPWDGKHRLSRNAKAPLKAVVSLRRKEENLLEPLSKEEAFPVLMSQCYRPRNPAVMARVISLEKTILDLAEFYRLSCNMSPEAAQVAYRGMNPEA